jgi:hypothetical protein
MKADPDNRPVLFLTASNAVVPALIAARGRHAGRRFVEFFTANIRNPNTRKAYYRAACEFFDWCDNAGFGLLDIEPVHGCGVGRGARAPIFAPDRQAMACRRMHAVRLAGGRPGPGGQSCRRGARSQICGPHW